MQLGQKVFFKKKISNTKMIVGLGNPGPKYQNTLHNAGFIAVDKIAHDLNANYWKSICNAQVATCKFTSQLQNVDKDVEVVLVKPQGFMNTSGVPLKAVMKKFSVAPEDIIVIHDELDIAPGLVRVKFGGGLAGHNGLKSIAEQLQTRDWARVRAGIGRPPGQMDVSNYVLSSPKPDNRENFEFACASASLAAIFLLDHSLEEAQQKFNSSK